MSKRTYRAKEIKRVEVSALSEQVSGRAVVFGVDVAKQWQYGALQVAGEVLGIWRWRQPEETRELLSLLRSLGASAVSLVMESSGTYGDALREQAYGQGFSVYQVSPKRVKDAQEVYDGVPSRHDAKSAVLLAWLHEQGRSRSWERESDEARELRARLWLLEMSRKAEQVQRNRLEGLLARHWPELLALSSLENASTLELLVVYGGSRGVREDIAGSRELLRRVGGTFLRQEQIEKVISSATVTTGVAMVAAEEELVQYLAREARRSQQEAQQRERAIKASVAGCPELKVLAEAVGEVTSAALVVLVGDPRRYANAGSYQKAMGLNLKEVSSGQRQGQLSLSKRGPGRARFWMFFAALRVIQQDAVVRSWYEAKVARDGGTRMKAVVAVMRKLTKALWHVGRGERFDSRRLFDVKRLDLAA